MEDDTIDYTGDTVNDNTYTEDVDFNDSTEESSIDDLYDSINIDEDTNNDIEDFDFNSSDDIENCEVDELFEQEMGYNPTNEELEGFNDTKPDLTLNEYQEQNEEFEKEDSEIDTMLENIDKDNNHKSEINDMMDEYFNTSDDSDDDNFQKKLRR